MITGVDEATAMKLLAEAEAAAPALGAHGNGKVLADLERHYPELLHAIASHHDRNAARTAEAAVLYHANQLDAVAATRPVD